MPYKNPAAQREYQRTWASRRRELFLKNKRCSKCGSKHKLQVDHIDPALKISHRIWSWSEKKRKAELKKCQVLCLKCHGVKSGKERVKPVVHGTRGGYFKGCRCNLCSFVQKEYMRQWKSGIKPGKLLATKTQGKVRVKPL